LHDDRRQRRSHLVAEMAIRAGQQRESLRNDSYPASPAFNVA
jgi:hypothetical protein